VTLSALRALLVAHTVMSTIKALVQLAQLAQSVKVQHPTAPYQVTLSASLVRRVTITVTLMTRAAVRSVPHVLLVMELSQYVHLVLTLSANCVKITSHTVMSMIRVVAKSVLTVRKVLESTITVPSLPTQNVRNAMTEAHRLCMNTTSAITVFTAQSVRVYRSIVLMIRRPSVNLALKESHSMMLMTTRHHA